MAKARSREKGAALIEFAISFLLFWMLVIGLIELSRLMLAWNAAGDAVQLAARLESTCPDSSKTDERVKALVAASGQLASDGWTPDVVPSDDGQLLKVQLNNVILGTLIPGFPAITLPSHRFSAGVMQEAGDCQLP